MGGIELLTFEDHGLRFSAGGAKALLMDVTRVVDGRHVDQVHLAAAPTNVGELAAAAAEWVARRLGAVPPPPVRCRSCGTELTPALNSDTDTQFDGALVVTFTGGFSMYVDPVTSEEVERLRVVICQRCADELCEQVPWAAEALHPRGGP